jgi:hypothetical protein
MQKQITETRMNCNDRHNQIQQLCDSTSTCKQHGMDKIKEIVQRYIRAICRQKNNDSEISSLIATAEYALVKFNYTNEKSQKKKKINRFSGSTQFLYLNNF